MVHRWCFHNVQHQQQGHRLGIQSLCLCQAAVLEMDSPYEPLSTPCQCKHSGMLVTQHPNSQLQALLDHVLFLNRATVFTDTLPWCQLPNAIQRQMIESSCHKMYPLAEMPFCMQAGINVINFNVYLFFCCMFCCMSPSRKARSHSQQRVCRCIQRWHRIRITSPQRCSIHVWGHSSGSVWYFFPLLSWQATLKATSIFISVFSKTQKRS